MSETIEAIRPDGDAGPAVTHTPNARMRWMADLVCAILDVETDRKAAVVGGHSDASRHTGNS